MGTSKAGAVKKVAAKKGKNGIPVTIPKIKMTVKYDATQIGMDIDSDLDNLVRKQIIKMVSDIAIYTRKDVAPGSKKEAALVSEANEKGEIKSLVHGSMWSLCNCSGLYPHHVYSFGACVHNTANESVGLFDIEVKVYPKCRKRRKAKDLKARFFDLNERYEEIAEGNDIESPEYEDLSSKQSWAQGSINSLEELEERAERHGALSPSKTEEYDDIINGLDDQLDEFEEALENVEGED